MVVFNGVFHCYDFTAWASALRKATGDFVNIPNTIDVLEHEMNWLREG